MAAKNKGLSNPYVKVNRRKRIGFNFSDKHKRYIKNCANSTYNILEGAVRSGKTVDNVFAFAHELKTTKDRIHLATGSTMANAKLNIGDANGFGLEYIFRGQCRWTQYKGNDCLLINGPDTGYKDKIVIFAGGAASDSYKKIRGNSYGMWIATEINLHHDNTIKEAFNRQLAAKNRKIFWDLNPDHPKAARDRFRKEVPLSEVDEWAGLSEEPVIIGNIDKPLFAYIKVPKANNIDTDSPLGVSVFSRATEIIEQADIQYGRVLWEYKATEAAILGDSELFQTDKHGKPVLPAGQERMFKTFDFDSADGTNKGLLKEYAPQIRHEALFQGLNKQLMKIEFLVGLAYGTLSEPTDIEKTAYEIRVSKQRSYHTVTAMQDAWHKGFKKIIYAMRVLALLYDMVPDGETELNCNWGDGVLEDTEAEYQRRWSMVVAGKLKTEAFLAWYFGCSEEEAKNMMPEPVARFPTEE